MDKYLARGVVAKKREGSQSVTKEQRSQKQAGSLPALFALPQPALHLQSGELLANQRRRPEAFEHEGKSFLRRNTAPLLIFPALSQMRFDLAENARPA